MHLKMYRQIGEVTIKDLNEEISQTTNVYLIFLVKGLETKCTVAICK